MMIYDYLVDDKGKVDQDPKMEDSQVTLLGFNMFQLAMNHGQFHPWLDSGLAW